MQNATVDEIIEWRNIGSVTHNLVFRTDASTSDPVLASGGVWQVKFTIATLAGHSSLSRHASPMGGESDCE